MCVVSWFCSVPSKIDQKSGSGVNIPQYEFKKCVVWGWISCKLPPCSKDDYVYFLKVWQSECSAAPRLDDTFVFLNHIHLPVCLFLIIWPRHNGLFLLLPTQRSKGDGGGSAPDGSTSTEEKDPLLQDETDWHTHNMNTHTHTWKHTDTQLVSWTHLMADIIPARWTEKKQNKKTTLSQEGALLGVFWTTFYCTVS